MLSQSGIPVIYSGDEIGQLNDYSYHENPEKAADSRYLHRGDFRWDLAENRRRPETVQGKLFPALDHLENSEKFILSLTAMLLFIRLIPGILLSWLLYVKMKKRNSLEFITSVNTIKLHGSTKKTAYTQI